jgi:hypothetical protein
MPQHNRSAAGKPCAERLSSARRYRLHRSKAITREAAQLKQAALTGIAAAPPPPRRLGARLT